MTIILVTNLTQQARRLADRTMFLLNGEIVEVGPTRGDLLGRPGDPANATSTCTGSSDEGRHTPRFSIETRDLNLWYGSFQALKDVTLGIRHGLITSLIGPSGCGKTTLLRCFNRINERYGGVTTQGEDQDSRQEHLRRRRLAARAAPARSAWSSSGPIRCPSPSTRTSSSGLRVHSDRDHRRHVRASTRRSKQALPEVGLWDDLKDRLRARATDLQLEQQQKLCIARLLPLKPEVILMDEPCSALDIDGTRAIEELMLDAQGRATPS